MAAFASPEWIESLATRAAAFEVDPSLDITIEQRIEDSSPVAWHMTITGGRIAVTSGENPDATLRLSSNRVTAEAIQAGTLSAQRAFLDGALRVDGDIGRLIDARASLDTVAALLTGIT